MSRRRLAATPPGHNPRTTTTDRGRPTRVPVRGPIWEFAGPSEPSSEHQTTPPGLGPLSLGDVSGVTPYCSVLVFSFVYLVSWTGALLLLQLQLPSAGASATGIIGACHRPRTPRSPPDHHLLGMLLVCAPRPSPMQRASHLCPHEASIDAFRCRYTRTLSICKC